MTSAASNASAFFEQVARDRHVFTVVSEGEFLVFPTANGDVVPWWSSRTRLERVQAGHSRYRAFDIEQISLNAFLRKTLPQLQTEGVRLGTNWSGSGLTGYDYSADDVRRNLRHWLASARLKGG